MPADTMQQEYYVNDWLSGIEVGVCFGLMSMQ